MSLSQALNQFAQNLGRYHKQHILILVSAALFPAGRNHLSTKEQQQ